MAARQVLPYKPKLNVTIKSLNILSHGRARDSEQGLRPSSALANECADTDANGFPFADPAVLEWDFRKGLLLVELLDGSPDFITLQEVDELPYPWFESELGKAGYGNIWIRDCVIAYKIAKWDLDLNSVRRLTFKGTSQAFICATFTSGDRDLIVGTTHLKAKPAFAEVRAAQTMELLDLVDEEQALRSKPLPIIIAGDFNAEPTEECCKMMAKEFRSAYAGIPDHYTTYKLRDLAAGPIKREIDYIWYSGLDLVDRLQVPEVTEQSHGCARDSESRSAILAPAYLPNATWPSDHLSLMATFGIH